MLLYDGTCGLCHKSVRWILRHERDHALMFAPLQGSTTDELRKIYPEIPKEIRTIVLVEDGKVKLRGKAFLYLSKHLKAPWRWMHAFRWIPRFLLDPGYLLVAKIRYGVWGRADLCELPSPEHRDRFKP